MAALDFRIGAHAVDGVTGDAVRGLTERATRSTFYLPGMSKEQLEANARIPQLARTIFFEAAREPHQHLAAAFEGDRLTGFVIATRHGPDDHELDWLMVDPECHGSGLSGRLMEAGMEWLGIDRPMWLTVIRHNARAIRFYRRFGFEIDEASTLDRPVPSCIMRRGGATS